MGLREAAADRASRPRVHPKVTALRNYVFASLSINATDRNRLLTFIDEGLDNREEWRDHIPSGYEDQSGYGHVSCSCGWDSSDGTGWTIGWIEHVDAAIDPSLSLVFDAVRAERRLWDAIEALRENFPEDRADPTDVDADSFDSGWREAIDAVLSLPDSLR